MEAIGEFLRDEENMKFRIIGRIANLEKISLFKFTSCFRVTRHVSLE